MTNPVEKYLTALERFNLALAELTAKYEQAALAREEALHASAELRRELEVNEQRVQDISVVFRQQGAMELTAKTPASSGFSTMPEMRRAS